MISIKLKNKPESPEEAYKKTIQELEDAIKAIKKDKIKFMLNYELGKHEEEVTFGYVEGE